MITLLGNCPCNQCRQGNVQVQSSNFLFPDKIEVRNSSLLELRKKNTHTRERSRLTVTVD